MSEATFYTSPEGGTFYCGWLGPDKERKAWEEVKLEEQVLAFEMSSEEFELRCHYSEFNEFPQKRLQELQDLYKNRLFTWMLERNLYAQNHLPYELIPTYTQDTGNCVAAGIAGTGQKLQVIEMSHGGQEEEFREWYIPWIYAISRNQIGRGMSGAGSLGIWGAKAVNEYGVLFSDDIAVPGTNGYSDRWGHRRNAGKIKRAEYGKFVDIASDNKLDVIRCADVDQLQECMDAGMQATIASYQGFKVVKYRDLHVYRPSGRWAHQMHITDIRKDPELMFYRMNQWGPNHTKPLNGETPGGAWNTADDLEREWNSRVEVYAYTNFAGEKGDPRHDFI